MKRCPQCDRVETDEALKFCRFDGATLVPESSGLVGEVGRAQPGPDASEVQTSILPHRTDADINRATGPTTALPAQVPAATSALPKTKRRKIIVVAVFVTALFAAVTAIIVNSYLSRKSTGAIESVAVLPFENGSGNAELEYLSDGVSESVIDRLAQLPQLKVIARSSSFRYRGQNLNLQEIATALGVDAIVTGRVVQRGESYLIRVDVTDVRENKQLWGENFTRKAADVQALQTDISREIAENLRLRLSGTQTQQLASSGATNPQAYELLLKGRFQFNKPGRESFDRAVEYYEQAIAVDANYALAHAELAEGYNYNGGRGLDLKQILLKQEAAAQRALELDNGLAEAHYALAEVRRKQWRWQEAEREYLRAIELNPNLPRAYRGYSQYLGLMRRHDEAIANAKRAGDLDPLSIQIIGTLGSRLYAARRFDEAIAAYQKTAELTPESPVPNYWLGNVYAAKGMYPQAIAEFQESVRKGSGDTAIVEALIGVIYAKTGERRQAEEILEKVRTSRREAAPPNARLNYEGNLALLYDALGMRDEAFATLEKAYAERNPTLPFAGTSPAFDNLRSDSRFKDLLKRMGLPE